MPSLFSIIKVAILTTFVISSALAKPSALFHHETLEQQVFLSNKAQDFFTFNHPAFSEYTLRFKKPTLCDPNVEQISGYLDIGKDQHFFFWFFESRNQPESDPIVLWLNGGPGGSSLLGLFTELGPCRVTENGTSTYINEYSWTEKANVLFLDQPLNCGFSYGQNGALDTEAVGKQVYAFLQLFFSSFSKYAHLDFHIAGESYGGHYVPSIGSVINENNKGNFQSFELYSQKASLNHINLKSLLIGNGLTDPLVQYKYYSPMACDNSYGPVLNRTVCDDMVSKLPTCERLIQACYNAKTPSACLPAALQCEKDQVDPYFATGMNPYDVRKKCVKDVLCYEIFDALEVYLNQPDVMKELGAEVDHYANVNFDVNQKFFENGDLVLPIVHLIPGLLEDGIKVLVYAGDADFVCNWMGNKAWTIELPWSGHKEFAQANDTEWYSERLGKQAGELRQTKDGRFAFLRILNAGHMAPYDQAESSLDMLQQWLRNELQ